MRINVSSNIEIKKNTNNIQVPDTKMIKIGCFRDGGFGDAFFAYATIKAIKRAYPSSHIELLCPHGSFLTLFHNCNFCSIRRASYGEIYEIEKRWQEYYDMWFSLRPRTYSAYDQSLLNYSSIRSICEVSIERQNSLHCEDFYINKNKRDIAERKLYGDGDIEALDVMNYIHNLDSKFEEVREGIESCLPRNMSMKDPYVTVHQWAFTGRGRFNSKFWPIDYWRKLANFIKNKLGYNIIQLGSTGEDFLGDPIINYLGRTDFFSSLRMMQDAVLHIDIEGSLIHASEALQIPCISLVGPSAKYWRHSRSNCITYVAPDPSLCDIMECERFEGGWHYRCAKKDGYALCMESISPEDVWNVIINKINT